MNAVAKLAVALGVVMAASAHAQSKQELIRKVIDLQKPAYESVARSVARQPAGQVMQQSGQLLRRVPADQREAVAKAMSEDVRKFYGDVEPMLRDRAVAVAPAALAPVLEAKFSEDELKQLIAWLESPVARKYQEVSPELGNALTRQLVADTRATIEPKIKALQETLNKRVSAAASAASAPSGSQPK